MPLIQVIGILCLCALAIWAFRNVEPLKPMANVVTVVITIVVIVWLVALFTGVGAGSFSNIHIGK
jgi:asparagine N-glycosylation enzyme membrane subunit Stt3